MPKPNVSIAGLDKAEVLVMLYCAAGSQSLPFCIGGSEKLTLQKAQRLVKKGSKFNCIFGRILKVDLSGDEFNPSQYDLSSEWTAQHVINRLRERPEVVQYFDNDPPKGFMARIGKSISRSFQGATT